MLNFPLKVRNKNSEKSVITDLSLSEPIIRKWKLQYGLPRNRQIQLKMIIRLDLRHCFIYGIRFKLLNTSVLLSIRKSEEFHYFIRFSYFQFPNSRWQLAAVCCVGNYTYPYKIKSRYNQDVTKIKGSYFRVHDFLFSSDQDSGEDIASTSKLPSIASLVVDPSSIQYRWSAHWFWKQLPFRPTQSRCSMFWISSPYVRSSLCGLQLLWWWFWIGRARRSNAITRDQTNVYSVLSWSSLQATGARDEANCIINEKLFVWDFSSAGGICYQ